MGAALLVSAIPYSGTRGEPYSPLNHFASELGELGVSQLAVVFNVGQVIGGLSFAIFFVALGRARHTSLARIYAPVGVVAGLGVTFVGVFPMNYLRLHTISALTFFLLGWICIGLASADFVRRRDRRFPARLATIGAVTVAAFLGFVVVVTLNGTGLAAPSARPSFWAVPTLEWAVIVLTLIWTFATSASWWRAERGARD